MTTDAVAPWHPVRFRVTGMAAVPEAAASTASLCVERVDHLGPECLPVPRSWLLPLHGALAAAIATQTVYWVSWEPAARPPFPTPDGDAAIQRLLHSVASGQTISSGGA